MKAIRPLIIAMIILALCLVATITYFTLRTDRLYVHIGKSYSEVVKDSTFPVIRKTALYPGNPQKVDSTWITSPVIITFDDPDHGFTLPKTLYGAVGYKNEKVESIKTSPMLKALPFDQVIKLLNDLQTTLKTSGWTPDISEGNGWIIASSDEERVKLQAKLFTQVERITLLIPKKYSLLIHLKCYARCDERNNETARYLIDLGMSDDFFSNTNE
ncbi:hypothetical protein AO391_19925 [Pseudomonas marginalis ICMP 9505]|nr:hypothetical protein AO391_19925 [Pseudomonas marginalis ICMP 9505]